MRMLGAYLHGQERQEAWQAYTAQMIWYLNRIEHERIGKKFDHPTWMEMIHPKPQDKRSGMEIVQDLKAKFMERKKKRKGGK